MTNTQDAIFAQIWEKALTQDLSIETDDTPPAAKSKGIAKTVMLDIEKHEFDNTDFMETANMLILTMLGFVNSETKYDPEKLAPATLKNYIKLSAKYFRGSITSI